MLGLAVTLKLSHSLSEGPILFLMVRHFQIFKVQRFALRLHLAQIELQARHRFKRGLQRLLERFDDLVFRVAIVEGGRRGQLRQPTRL